MSDYSLMTGIVDSIRKKISLPEISEACCVHSRFAIASCSSCVDICPVDAWMMDDEQLGIDTELCDGCGLCAAACPEQALSIESNLNKVLYKDSQTIFAQCEKTSDANSGIVPCIHAINLQELSVLHDSGIRQILVHHSDCQRCSRHTSESLDVRIANINKLLSDRCNSQLTIQHVSTQEAIRLRQYSDQVFIQEPAVSRRGFFKAITRKVVNAKDVMTHPDSNIRKPPGKLIPRKHARGVCYFLPEIDTENCHACDTCANACAHGAISISDDSACYALDPDACTNCNLCVDVCESEAVTVRHLAKQTQFVVPLVHSRCDGCGAMFKCIASQCDGNESLNNTVHENLCSVCAKSHHYKNLFQVLA